MGLPHRSLVIGGIATLCVSSLALAPAASAEPALPNQIISQETSVPASNITATPYTASGVSWAPGGALASISLRVNGNGTYVQNANVAYQTGTAGSNACVDTFEIAYYEHGQRRVQTSGRNCAIFRTTHTFGFNRHIDANRPFCGRVRIGGAWSNFACIDIRP